MVLGAASMEKPARLVTVAEGEPRVISLLEIAKTFLHIGLVSYSLAALGEAKKDLVEKKNWLTDEQYLKGVALSQLLPGAPTVNLNSYIGYFLRGFPGSLIGCITFVLPCFIEMVILTHLYLNYNDIPMISSLFRGIGALVVGLVLNTIINLWKSGVNSVQLSVLAVGGFVMVYILSVSIVPLLLVAGGVSLLFAILTARCPGWKTIMDRRFWTAGRPVRRDVSAIRFRFSKARYLTMLVMLAGLLAVNFAVNFSNPTFQQLGNTLFKIGGLTFGSGYAMLPFIQDNFVNQYHWLSEQEFGVALALSLITSGPVTVVSAFVGYKVAGIFGAALAMANMYLPAFAVVNMIADLYNRAGEVESVKLVVGGVVAAFIGTLWVVIIRLATSSLVDLPTCGIALAAFLVQRFTKTDTLWIVVGGAVVSLLIF